MQNIYGRKLGITLFGSTSHSSLTATASYRVFVFVYRYNPHPNETFMPNLLHHVYSSPLEDLCPRRLALLLMILAVGCLVNLNEAPDSPDAEKYHHLARASLTEIPVMEDTTVDTISALFYM